MKKAKKYAKSKLRASVVEALLSGVFLIAFYFTGASAMLAQTMAEFAQNFYFQLLGYTLAFGAIYYVLFAGFDYYRDFVLEHRFNLSNEKLGTFVKRSFKKLAITVPLFIIVVQLVYMLFRNQPRYWPLFMTGVWLFIAVVLGKIIATVIIPMFYKLEPLDRETEIYQRLNDLSKRCQVAIEDIYLIDLSSETRKTNAAVAGFGRSRRILLGDSLMQTYSPDEIEAVFAHELGHITLGHNLKLMAISAVVTAGAFYLVNASLGLQIRYLAIENIYDIEAFPLVLLIFMLAGLIFAPLQNSFGRRIELQADMFALENASNPASLATALNKLSGQNLADTAPGRVTEILFYDHPPITKRIDIINRALGSGTSSPQ